MNPAWRHWRTLEDWLRDEQEVFAAEQADLPQERDVAGECAVCGSIRGFRHAPGSDDLREGLNCLACACNSRQRAAAMLLLDGLRDPARAQVYATEQASLFYIALRRKIPQLRGSEFETRLSRRLKLSRWMLEYGVLSWIRNEDVTRLSFGDASLDGAVSLDVLEHVPNFEKALAEFARVLRPGASLALTVPFYFRAYENATIACIRADGSIEHDGEPEYHGDPISGGVLCFHHFGWQLLDSMRAAGFSDAVAYRARDAAYGLPQGQWVLLARR